VKASEHEIPGRIIAVDHVELQAPLGAEPDLLWFYGELIGLKIARPEPSDSASSAKVLRFRSDRCELRISLVEQPKVEAIASRAFFEVPNFTKVMDILEERRYDYEYFRGLAFTERHLSLLDPAGNRVLIRRYWPTAFL